jgi:O-antigen/teichoic acid export membrane protein
MTLTKKIFQNTIVQISGKIFSTILGLATVMIMTRHLGAERFGWYVTAVSFLQFIGILSDFGFTITTSNMLAEPRFEKRSLINTIFTWRFITALLFNGLAPLIILFFPYSREIKLAVAIISLAFFAIALNQVFLGYYQTKLKTYVQTVGDLIGRTTLLILVWLFSRYGIGFLPIMGAVTLGACGNTAYLWLKSNNIGFSLNKEISKALLKKIWPVALAVIFNAFYLYGDRVILPLYAEQTTVGLYGAAYRILDVVTQIAALVMGLMLPLITFSWSRQHQNDFARRSEWAFELVMVLLLPMITGAIALSTPIMNFLGGEEFIPAAPILRLLIFAAFGISIGMIFGHINLAIGQQKRSLWIYISDAVLSVIGYFIFIPRYGMYGAAYVTIFSEFYAGLMLLLLAHRYSNFVPRIFILFKIILASAVMGLTIYLLPQFHLLISIMIGALIYTSLVLSLKIIPRKTIQEIFAKPTEPVAESTENW